MSNRTSRSARPHSSVRWLKAEGRAESSKQGAKLPPMTAKTTSEDWAEAEANAPIGEPLTDDERRLLAEARESRARGDRSYTQAEVEALLAERRKREVG